MKRSKNLNLNNRYIEPVEIKENNTIYTGCWGVLTQVFCHPIRPVDPERAYNSCIDSERAYNSCIDSERTGKDFSKEQNTTFILTGDNIYVGYI